MAFPLPDNEPDRLAQLQALEIMGSASLEGLDGLCVLAQQVLGVPYACVGLVDRDRQWFLANAGFGEMGTSREHSFSTWTILSSEMLVVPDARLDPRFANNPYVLSEPGIRFYIGCPIALQPGVNIGSLCLFGSEPRQITPSEQEFVVHIARLVVDQLRLHAASRQTKRELEQRRANLRLLEVQSRELWRRQTLLAQTERMAKVGGWEYDVATQRLEWSDGIYRIYGITPGCPPTSEMALSHFPDEARQQFARKFEAALRRCEPFEVELPFVDAQGHHRMVRKTCAIEADDRKAVRAFGILQDITNQKEVEQRMWHMANHDALTNLPNRGLMREKLDAALKRSRRSGGWVGLLAIDVDQFKDVNDTLGHDAGDALLIETARRLLSCVGEVDTVARLGGDEFIVILEQVDSLTDAMVIADRILEALQVPFFYRRAALSCRSSIGVAAAPEHGADAVTLLKNVDLALYKAKSGGRGIVAECDLSMLQATENRLQLAGRIRLALKNGELQPYYQPLISLETGNIVGFEALLRWRHPRKGLLGPGEFASAFEDPDLAVAIGERVLELTTRDMASWLAANCPFNHVAINVSSAEFARGELPQRVISGLDKAGVPPGCLVIEVTETVFLGRGAENVRVSLEQLSKAGIHIALDDFGTGYASLSHLKQFPVDQIKIDRSFVQDIKRDIDDAAIVRAVINLARSLGIRTVAEGVETTAQSAYLRLNSCDFVQGFLYSKAVPASRVPALLRGWMPWGPASAKQALADGVAE